MTWLSPWAFLGLAAMALPILVHWLARHEADRRPFPTVRFVPTTPPTSVRRHRLTDLVLLALRCAIIAAAAAALAQPALRTAPAPGGRPPRAIVVDTSASMLRTLAGDTATTGATAADAAVATALADADTSVVVRDSDVRRALSRAGAWLREQPGAGEVVVISDFQVGAISDADFDALPASAGRRFVRVGVAGTVPAPAGAGTVRVYGAPAAEAAARAVVGGDSTRAEGAPAIVVAFAGAPEFAPLKADARPIDTPEMYALAMRVAEKTSGVFFGSIGDPKKTPDVFSAVVFLSTAPPDSVEAATLIANALRAAAAPAVSLPEREPDTTDAAVVDSWQREPRPDVAPGSGDPYSLSRWVWGLVLALLALETWVRRQRATAVVSQEVPHARVA